MLSSSSAKHLLSTVAKTLLLRKCSASSVPKNVSNTEEKIS
ncbi:hypothetical protein L917_20739 [Phytophthora nicotianae]|uniref:Uncharacterized protein n=1 Tax=Phytophthora nicotianae TaxID=4792 RepID=W2JZV7_PHYNI|nr:hypothetical protein L917_20739 [Phytophthora nicotianae]